MNWLERRKKKNLLGLKRIKINGMRFTIRRVNAMMDFPAEKVPQLFTEIQSARKPDPTKPPTAEQVRAMRDVMLNYIEAGVIEPRLVPVGAGDKNGKEDGITAEDLCRHEDMGMKLYWEILSHSLNTFKGIKGVFFSIKQRLLLSMLLPLGMGLSRLMSSHQTLNQPPSNDNNSISLSPELPLMKNTDNSKNYGVMPNAGTANG